MEYAIVKIKGTQYKVEKGQEILVNRVGTDGVSVEVLMYVKGDVVKVGKPTLSKPKVKVKVLEDEVKGKKMYVHKFRAKSRYRKKIGHRDVYTKVLIKDFSN